MSASFSHFHPSHHLLLLCWKMNSAIKYTLVAAIVLRLFTSCLLFPSNISTANGDIISRALGPGILRAIGSAVLDPVHTWDHLEEACFWLEDGITMVENTSFNVSKGSYNDSGYVAVYTPGTRIVAPPLVIAVLGQALVCRRNSVLLRIIKLLLLTLADGIGAYCIYFIGYRIFQAEKLSNEEEMERNTVLSQGGDKAVNEDLVIPEILRPEMGWSIGLPNKMIPTDKCSLDMTVTEAKACNGKNHLEAVRIDNGEPTLNDTTSFTLLEREPILLLDQLPIIASLCYFGNPISMLANASGSLRSLWDSFLLLSLYYATIPVVDVSKNGISKNTPSATKVSLFLALASYVDAGYVMFLFPILLWRGLLHTSMSTSITQHKDWNSVLLLYIVQLGGLHYLASFLVSDGQSMYAKVMIQTVLPNVAFVQKDGSGAVPGPSMGLHW